MSEKEKEKTDDKGKRLHYSMQLATLIISAGSLALAILRLILR